MPYIPPPRLSRHFATSEFEVTSTGLPNRLPDAGVHSNLRLLVHAVLEPLRSAIGNKPITVTSGYRSMPVNVAVGGSTDSLHLQGLAADIVVEDRPAAWQMLVGMASWYLPFDQAILYQDTRNHIHTHMVTSRAPRRQLLVKTPDGYVQWCDYTGELT